MPYIAALNIGRLQMEENLQRLEEDGEFRREYLAMWAESRPKPEASSTDPNSSRPRVDEKVSSSMSKGWVLAGMWLEDVSLPCSVHQTR